METLTLTYESWAVEVKAPDAAMLVWLRDFLDCGFEPTPGRAPDCRIQVVISETAYQRLHERGPHDEGLRSAGFAQHSSERMFQQWASDERTTIFHDDLRPFFYVLEDPPPRVTILCRSPSPKLGITLMKVVRELAMESILVRGGTILHASAVSTGDGALVIAGPRRSGKTTLLISLLQSDETAYLANDRCVLRVENGSPKVQSLPTLVSIRGECLRRFPRLLERAKELRLWPAGAGDHDTAQGGSAGSEGPEEGDEDLGARLSISPSQFHELLRCRRTSSGPVRALIFPEVTRSPARMTLSRLAPAQVREHWRGGLFRAGRPRVLGGVFVFSPERRWAAERGDGRLPAEVDARVGEWISHHLPVFHCRLGGDEILDPAEVRSLIRLSGV
jgi:hypothetical protein